MLHEHIKNRVRNLGLKAGDFAAVIGVSQPMMSNFLRGRSNFDPARMKELLAVLDDLESLKKVFPVPVAMHDPKLLAITLERLRAGLFEPFRSTMKQVDWENQVEPEHMSRKYPKLWSKT